MIPLSRLRTVSAACILTVAATVSPRPLATVQALSEPLAQRVRDAAKAQVRDENFWRQEQAAASEQLSMQVREQQAERARQERAAADKRAAEKRAAEKRAAEARAAQQRAAERGAGQRAGSSAPASDPRAIAATLIAERGWSDDQFQCLDKLWAKESSWKHTAANPSASAYGIPQALPGHKMSSHGADWRTNPATQIAWGLDYIAGRYQNPCRAWSHSQASNWY